MHPAVFGRRQCYTVSGEGVLAQEVQVPWQAGVWVSLGQFDFKRGKAFVVLDDRILSHKGDVQDKRFLFTRPITQVTADAVKWVKVK